jgi:3-methyl-2-oxobutanoate hydroxymethyltransferase
MTKGIGPLQEKKERGEKIVMLTAYDFPTAVIAAAAGADILLVGDSLGNVVLGYDTTIPVTMEDILHHTHPVVRGAAEKGVFIVADMPFGSYHISIEETLRNAFTLIKDGGADAIKLEGGEEILPIVSELTKRGIPVMAHIGLVPQTASLWQGYKVQGHDEVSAWALVKTAQKLAEAGAFSVVLECVTRETAALITNKVPIITIGIGSGSDCDGQVLVSHDLLGLTQGNVPRFVKQFGYVGAEMERAFAAYAEEVRAGTFPDPDHSFAMEENEAKKIK